MRGMVRIVEKQQKKEKESTLDPIELAIEVNKRSNDILIRTLGTEQEVHILKARIIAMEQKLAIFLGESDGKKE